MKDRPGWKGSPVPAHSDRVIGDGGGSWLEVVEGSLYGLQAENIIQVKVHVVIITRPSRHLDSLD